jgi:hypothetical protein
LNLNTKTDSPQRRFAAKLRMEERKFREQFDGRNGFAIPPMPKDISD